MYSPLFLDAESLLLVEIGRFCFIRLIAFKSRRQCRPDDLICFNKFHLVLDKCCKFLQDFLLFSAPRTFVAGSFDRRFSLFLRGLRILDLRLLSSYLVHTARLYGKSTIVRHSVNTFLVGALV